MAGLALAAVGLAGCTTGAGSAAAPEQSRAPVAGLEFLAGEELRDTGAPAVELEQVDAGPREQVPSALQAVVDRSTYDEALPTPLLNLSDIVDGGQPPDGIPPLDEPRFQPTAEVHWVDDAEQVLVVDVGGEQRAYPVQVLTLHEIVNDTVGGVPVAVTYCPLCASGVAFDRRVEGRVLSFGTSGRLYRSDLVMYDRQTESLWPQIEGRAAAGALTGEELEVLPASLDSWEQWRTAHPDGWVLSRQTGFDLPYGSNPYYQYDDKASLPLFLAGPIDIEALRVDGVREVSVGGRDMTVWWLPGTRSSLDGFAVGEGREVGTTAVFEPTVDGRRLTFRSAGDGTVVDLETSSSWNALGQAVSGPLDGTRLTPVTHTTTFWFAWSGFHEDTRVER